MRHEEYQKIEALNWSTLRAMARSPKAYQWSLSHPREDTASLALGRAIHCAVLEPEAFDARYASPVARRCAATTKAGDRCSRDALAFAARCSQHGGQAEADEWRAGNPGVEVLTADEGETVRACAAAVRAHPEASRLLAGCEFERTIQWRDEVTGTACKGRLDALGPGGAYIIDLKKTDRDLDLLLRRGIAELLYHGQGAWYTDGARTAGLASPISRYYLIGVETHGPREVGVIELGPGYLEAGRTLYRGCLAELLSCRETGVWYGRFPTIVQAEPPRWAPGMEEP